MNIHEQQAIRSREKRKNIMSSEERSAVGIMVTEEHFFRTSVLLFWNNVAFFSDPCGIVCHSPVMLPTFGISSGLGHNTWVPEQSQYKHYSAVTLLLQGSLYSDNILLMIRKA